MPEPLQILSVIVPKSPQIVKRLRNPTWAWVFTALIGGRLWAEVGSHASRALFVRRPSSPKHRWRLIPPF
jgi:hypothetical protein